MIKVSLTNEILKYITEIEKNRYLVNDTALPAILLSNLHERSKKTSSYASTKIEGNLLTEDEVYRVIKGGEKRQFLKHEQEVYNYYQAINFLEKQAQKAVPFSISLLLETQAIVQKGSSEEKIGLRKQMPPGVLFAVYDSISRVPDYIPPEHSDIEMLLNELVNYVNSTDDHPLIVAATVHYQLVTIHPFEDGNGRTARLLSSYILTINGFGFNGIGSLEEYFAYDIDEYYSSIQMNLPALYYSGRNNPPHSEIWYAYFLRTVLLYSNKVRDIVKDKCTDVLAPSISKLNLKEKSLLKFILENYCYEFTPIELSEHFNVTNKTIINGLSNLVENNFVIPQLVNERIRKYELSQFSKENAKKIISLLTK